jgi:transposase
VILAAWGALGGATNALTTKMRLRDAIRHILLGGIIAAGMGSLSMALVARWLDLPPEAVAAGGRRGLGRLSRRRLRPAFIEVALARIRGKGGGRQTAMPELLRLRRACAATPPTPAGSSATACASASLVAALILLVSILR